MTHPLQLAKDYIPYDGMLPVAQVERIVGQKIKPDTKPKSGAVVAIELGLSYNYFTAKTKKVRCMKLLGAGDLKRGYEKYMELTAKTVESLNTMFDTLSNRIWGFEVFDRFAGLSEGFTRNLQNNLKQSDISQFGRLSKAHTMLKHFRDLEHLKSKALLYIPIEKRLPLTEKFIKRYYWRENMTTYQIANELVVPERHIQAEIKRLGMKKRENGIKPRGKKGFKMPEEQKVKHRKQPHSRVTVQIDPETFKVLRTFSSTGAVERDGWSRENVRKAIKSAGLHDGFLWAYEGEEEEMVQRVKAKGDLSKKLKIWKNGKVSKESIQELYIDQGLNKEEVAAILGCVPDTVAQCASRFKLSKQTKITTETLKRHYIKEGMSPGDIADMYGYSVSSIRTYLSKRGITKKKTA